MASARVMTAAARVEARWAVVARVAGVADHVTALVTTNQAKLGLMAFVRLLEALGNYIWSRAWEIADRSFKLASWGLLIAALFALDSKHPTPAIKATVGVLSVLWLFALLVSLIDAGAAFQDKAAEHLNAFKNPWMRIFFAAVVVLTITITITNLLPAAISVFAVVLDLARK